MEYIELHNHSDFSFGDAISTVVELADHCLKNDIPRIAITDHGNCLAWSRAKIEFEQRGLKPIYGMEAYFTPDRHVKEKDVSVGHITLIAESDEGIKSIFKLSEIGSKEGFYHYPRIDLEALDSCRNGIICLSGCVSSLMSQLVNSKRFEEAEKLFVALSDIYGKDNLFIELMFNDLKIQRIYNLWLLKMHQKGKFRLVVSSDSHYINPNDNVIHDAMIMMKKDATISKAKEKDVCYTVRDLFVKKYEDVKEAWVKYGFEVNPFQFSEAIESTSIISDRCVADLKMGEIIEPIFEVSSGNQEQYFIAKVAKAFTETIKKIDASDHLRYIEQIKKELKLILNKKLVNYFLIVNDIIEFATTKKIPVNARGSVAGSLISYALGISSVDPLRWNLSFDRFLNESRTDLPDIDLDVSDTGRNQIIDYLMKKYGADNTYPVVSFAKFNFKGLLRRLSKVMEIPKSVMDNALSDTYQDEKRKDVADLRDLKSEGISKLLEQYPLLRVIGNKLMGKMSHIGRHAAAIVITPTSMSNYAPIVRSHGIDHCGYDYDPTYTMLEQVGLMKLDILGLSTLERVQSTVDMINKKEETTIKLRDIPLDDKSVYEAFAEGDTIGSFQFNGAHMRKILIETNPTKLEHLTAINALYRPAAISTGVVKEYIEKKRNNFSDFPCEEIKNVLGETYGLILYQEQTMAIGMELGGMTGAEADNLRKAMTKLQTTKLGDAARAHELIDPLKEKIINGGMEKGIDKSYLEYLWKQMVSYSSYGFNAAHACSYAWLGYVTMWLKVNYPVEFFYGLMLNSDPSETRYGKTKIATYIDDAYRHNIMILPPDINKSNENWTIEEPKFDDNVSYLRMGFLSLKQIGPKPSLHITNLQPYNDLEDFYNRACGRDCSLRAMKPLIAAGAFDGFGNTPEETWKMYLELKSEKEEVEIGVTKFEAMNKVSLRGVSYENDLIEEILK